MQKNRLAAAATVLLMASSLASAAESGTALRDTEIKAEPFRDATRVAILLKGEKADILKREGAWMEVKSNRGKGWVHMLTLRRGASQKGAGEQSSLLALDSGRSGATGMVIATTGIRGLDSSATNSGVSDQALSATKFNEAELMRDESYTATSDKVQQFAKQGDLAERQVEYMADVK